MVTQRRNDSAPAELVEQLREQLAARDELIAVMGHELRNAMSPLVLLQEQLQGAPADARLARKLEMLARSLAKMQQTLDRVTEVSQLRAGKLRLAPAEIDVTEVVAEVCRELAARASASSCELRCTMSPVHGRWDRARLAQIVRHLAGNAIRYAAGSPIEITVREVEGHLELVIQDHGPGIPATERNGLFERFGRAAPRRNGGLGVGLWVVRSLCHAMHGTVELVDSEHGARFCVMLPRG